MDRLLVDLASQGADQSAQMGGFVGAYGNGVDLWEVVGGPEGRLDLRGGTAGCPPKNG
ncbi:hypothetical protein [Streptomyces gobiensis]|uniref:hypothetical protein n=1 Tax=Streptomyces gobiensis TaxID=2875706 RepID=UPI0030CF3574